MMLRDESSQPTFILARCSRLRGFNKLRMVRKLMRMVKVVMMVMMVVVVKMRGKVMMGMFPL